MMMKWVYFIAVLIAALLYLRSRGPERFYQQFFPVLLCFSPLYFYLVLFSAMGFYTFIYFVTVVFVVVLLYNYRLGFRFDVLDYLIILWVSWDVLTCLVASNLTLASIVLNDKIIGCVLPYYLARALVPRSATLRFLVVLGLTVTAIATLAPLEGLFNITVPSLLQPLWPEELPKTLFSRGDVYRVFSIFEHPIYAGGFFSIAIFIGALVLRIQALHRKWIPVAMILINSLALYLTVSRTSYILVPVTLLLMNLAFVKDKRRYVLIGIVVAGLLLVVGQPLYNALLKGGAEQAGSTAYREQLLDNYMPQILSSPIFGRPTGISVVGIQWSIDNYYLYLTLRFGVPSFLFFLLPIVVIVIRTMFSFHRLPLMRDQILSWFAVSCIGYLAFVGVSAWLSVQIRELLFIFMGLATNYLVEPKEEVPEERRIRWL